MAEAFREQQQDADVQRLSFEERLGLLIDRQWNWRENRALERRLRNARLQGTACVEDIDFRTARGLDRQMVRSLTAESVWVREHQTRLSHRDRTCESARPGSLVPLRKRHVATGTRLGLLVVPICSAIWRRRRVDGSHRKLLHKLAKTDVLVVDDWAMAPLSDAERRDFLEICDDRYQTRATLLTSQLPVPAWHAQIGDPTMADSILDRLVHNAHRIELAGESMRKRRTQKSGMPEA